MARHQHRHPRRCRRPAATIHARRPSGRRGERLADTARFFAGQGYVVAAQDLRGLGESEGRYRISTNERHDGDDTVTWLGTRPWSNGRVGTYGYSHLGEVQYQLAATRNPHHACMIPPAGGSVCAYNGPSAAYHTGGALNLMLSAWFRDSQHTVRPQFPAGLDRDLLLRTTPYFNLGATLPEVDFRALWQTLPIVDILAKAGGPPTDFESFLTHDFADPWWAEFGFVAARDRFAVPALHVNSWYDFGVAETLHLFNLLQQNSEDPRSRGNQFALISPALHCRSERMGERMVVGDLDFGDAQFDYWGLYLRWFDHWLKGVDNGVTAMPKVQYFAMGRNAWRHAGAWPPEGTRLIPCYLHGGGRANSRMGDGTLGPGPPGDEPPDRYVYDPLSPVPTVGGAHWSPHDLIPPGPYDQSGVEMRHDVLVCTSASLAEEDEVSGPLAVTLYVASSARDTDVTAKLVDVHPDGRAYNLQEGILRARYRGASSARTGSIRAACTRCGSTCAPRAMSSCRAIASGWKCRAAISRASTAT